MSNEDDNDDIVRKLLEEQSTRDRAERRRVASESALASADSGLDYYHSESCVGADMSGPPREDLKKSATDKLNATIKKEHINPHSVTDESQFAQDPFLPKPVQQNGAQFAQESRPGAHAVIPKRSNPQSEESTQDLFLPKPVLPNGTLPRQESRPGAHSVMPDRALQTVTDSSDDENRSSGHSRCGSLETGESRLSSDGDGNLVSALPVDDGDEENTHAIPQADPVNTDHKRSSRGSSLIWILGALVLTIVVVLVVVIIVVVLGNATNIEDSAGASPLGQKDQEQSKEEQVLNLLPRDSVDQLKANPNSPQALAFDWLAQDPFFIAGEYTEARILQRFALATLFYSTKGDAWTKNEHWLSYEHHECEWEFPTSVFLEIPALTFALATDSPCASEDVDVYTDLRLSRNKLKGQLPKEIGLLTSLKSMDISFNNLDGDLPDQAFVKLSELEIFTSVSNQHTGQIPRALFQLTSLSALVLYGTDLSGIIPSAIGDLSSLQLLALGDNRLSGTLPSEVGKLSQLVSLNVEKNSMTGTLATELGLLSSITDLYFRGNPSLTGSFPTQLGQLSLLDYASLGECQITGVIPSEFGLLDQITKLYLQDNLLYGNIPTQLGQLTALRRLKLQENQLSGSIPIEMASLRTLHALEHVDLRGNQLISGEIPEDLCLVEAGFDGQFDCSSLLCGCECPC